MNGVLEAGRRLALLAAVSLLLVGCDDAVADEWESQADVRDCGTTTVDQGDPIRPSNNVVSCFKQALTAGASARVTLTYPTIEGDPVHDHYLLHGDGTVTLYEDPTEDPNGADEWATTECFEPDWLPTATC
jgi:hypothetical protein